MALWLVRTGRHGEHEQKFLEENKVYLTWPGLRHDLSQVGDRDELKNLLRELEPDASESRLGQHVGQVWLFVQDMQPGDWVVVPSKQRAAVHIAEIKSNYMFDPAADDPYNHARDVEWIEQDIPRSNFDRDVSRSFNAIRTVCRIERNDAEGRVRAMAQAGWRVPSPTERQKRDDLDDDNELDPELTARSDIAEFINAKFDAHDFEELVKAILAAQGFTTHRTPKGRDRGIDVLAAPGKLGFGDPKICVQIKMWSNPADADVLEKLTKTMKLVCADHGLLVAWSGFRSAVERERAIKFFSVRLWDEDDLLDQLFEHYEKLDVTMRSKIPLKRVWTLATARDEG